MRVALARASTCPPPAAGAFGERPHAMPWGARMSEDTQTSAGSGHNKGPRVEGLSRPTITDHTSLVIQPGDDLGMILYRLASLGWFPGKHTATAQVVDWFIENMNWKTGIVNRLSSKRQMAALTGLLPTTVLDVLAALRVAGLIRTSAPGLGLKNLVGVGPAVVARATPAQQEAADKAWELAKQKTNRARFNGTTEIDGNPPSEVVTWASTMGRGSSRHRRGWRAHGTIGMVGMIGKGMVASITVSNLAMSGSRLPCASNK
jgi:hypothetical protein